MKVFTKGAIARLSILFTLLVGFGVWSKFTMFTNPEDPKALAAQVELLRNVYRYGNYMEAVI